MHLVAGSVNVSLLCAWNEAQLLRTEINTESDRMKMYVCSQLTALGSFIIYIKNKQRVYFLLYGWLIQMPGCYISLEGIQYWVPIYSLCIILLINTNLIGDIKRARFRWRNKKKNLSSDYVCIWMVQVSRMGFQSFIQFIKYQSPSIDDVSNNTSISVGCCTTAHFISSISSAMQF